MTNTLKVVSTLALLLVTGCQTQEVGKTPEQTTSQEQKTEVKTETDANDKFASDEQYQNIQRTLQYGTVTPFEMAAETKGWNFHTDNKKILAMPKDNKNDIMLLDEVTDEHGSILNLTMDNGWVYYEKASELWRVRPDGTDKQHIEFKGEHGTSPMSTIAYNEKLYYISKENIGYKANRDLLFIADVSGENIKPIGNDKADVLHLNIAGDKLYYSQMGNRDNQSVQVLNAIDLTDPSYGSKELFYALELQDFQIVNNQVYYLENNKMYKRNLDGSDIGQVSDNLVASFHIYNDKIYYKGSGDRKNEVLRMNLNGTNYQHVAGLSTPEEKPEFLNFGVTSNYAYISEFNVKKEPKERFVVEQLDLLDPAPTPEVPATEYSSEETYEELKKMYDEVVKQNKVITIQSLQEREVDISGGSELFPNDHIVGVTKILAFALTNEDKEMLRSICQNNTTLDKLLKMSVGFKNDREIDMGYSDISFQVKANNVVEISTSHLDAEVTFVNIGGRYYFEKMDYSTTVIKTN